MASTRIHIVAQADTWILGRCVSILQEHTGWTVSQKPDPKADVNYYMPYLLMARSERAGSTKTAAWFTHHEEVACGKAERWHQVAKKVDLRITMAQKYCRELEAHGPTVNIPLPVNVRKFRPRPLKVGVAGQVYALSRKGEALVARLTREPDMDVVGAGKGWPCPTTFYPWEKMHTFYQQLDVFLVTSLVEGGPVTLMEALACGIPVVAPRGVGIVDEFPVLTYERGNYEAMVRVLRRLLLGRQRRRALVKGLTAAVYAQKHRDALCAV